ncbi:MAG TPA: ATP-binding protein [Candidatus Acidoferrales bacterium]|nr:ATP-binding protein [Candidatus Acidoferrales bacterium]
MTARPQRRLWLGFGLLLIVLLLSAVFTLGSLDLPFQPAHWSDILVLYSVSTFIVAALLVFGFILTRMLLRLWLERRAGRPGTHFKTKMVVGAMALTLLPVAFLFFISYALLNRTLGHWFPKPLEEAVQVTQSVVNELGARDHERLNAYAKIGAESLPQKPTEEDLRKLLIRFSPGIDGIAVIDPREHAVNFAINFQESAGTVPVHDSQMPSGAELWKVGGIFATGGRAMFGANSLLAIRRLPPDFFAKYTAAQAQQHIYEQERQQYRVYKSQLLLSLSLFTLLLLFAGTWFALFLSKQVTVPIEALAEATREVSHGNFDYRVNLQAQDELGTLVRSFNEMTLQLGDSRKQIDDFTHSLQQAVQEIERRRKLLEAVLENIPTGVVSLDPEGNVVRLNSAAVEMFPETASGAQSLSDLIGPKAYAEVRPLLRRSLRMGAVSRALEIAVEGRVMHAAVTVSALGSMRRNPGFVVVIDDLTEMLRAQKSAAWQEVAQRIAHEIKNPLTPIQISAQRLERYLQRRGLPASSPTRDLDLEALVHECSAQIEREVATLKSLVDEFSQFVRFPQARLAQADANAVVREALEQFRDRLDGVQLHTNLGAELPAIKADAELLRGVIVNLIDNAAEAVDASPVKEIVVSTRAGDHGDSVEIMVSDTGTGISPEDKDKLFLPHFSTKDRGTGLGLAIAARVVAEHNGTIRADDNSPVGSRFVICLPTADVTAATPAEA